MIATPAFLFQKGNWVASDFRPFWFYLLRHMHFFPIKICLVEPRKQEKKVALLVSNAERNWVLTVSTVFGVKVAFVLRHTDAFQPLILQLLGAGQCFDGQS